jgi:hypothetical protein
MALEESVVDQAWAWSGGQCECTDTSHGHSERCSHKLLRERRGSDPYYWWQAHKKVTGGEDTLRNCEILCHECFKQTQTKKTSEWTFFPL